MSDKSAQKRTVKKPALTLKEKRTQKNEKRDQRRRDAA